LIKNGGVMICETRTLSFQEQIKLHVRVKDTIELLLQNNKRKQMSNIDIITHMN